MTCGRGIHNSLTHRYFMYFLESDSGLRLLNILCVCVCRTSWKSKVIKNNRNLMLQLASTLTFFVAIDKYFVNRLAVNH
jgi:hypothetical protein